MKEEKQKELEVHLSQAADIAKENGISLEKILSLMTIFYAEEE